MRLESSLEKTIAKNYEHIVSQIKKASQKTGSLKPISLVAVSKGQSFEAIKAAYNLGQRDFGESYAQELMNKFSECEKHKIDDLRWHFIGAIQSNKIKSIAKAHVIHSISSLRHATLIEEHAHHPIDAYIQVNLNKDPNRQGFFEEEIEAAIIAFKSFHFLRLKGFMFIAPITGEMLPKEWFALMNALRDHYQQLFNRPFSLSMGMSDDFIEAISHGADIIRVGSKIFGKRKA